MPEPMTPVLLSGRHVVLEPLTIGHVPELTAAATRDRSSFGLTWVPGDEPAMHDYVAELLGDQQRAQVLPFAQRSVATGRAVGCTRYLDPHWWRGRPEPDEIEIGGTWLGAEAQRSGINTEAKLLLLTHAFEQLRVWRVAICTDERNTQSRDAIERIGAAFEGILRNHRLRADAEVTAARDTAVYSIIDADWPGVRAGLEAKLAERG